MGSSRFVRWGWILVVVVVAGLGPGSVRGMVVVPGDLSPHSVGGLLERSEVLQGLSSLWMASAAAPPVCDRGGLVAEQAVTGAYNQACMNLPQRSVPLVVPGGGTVLTIEQGAAASGRTGMAVWNSGLLLVRLLERLWAGDSELPRSVVELGCGTGLASIAVGRLMEGAGGPPPRILATDGNPDIVALAQRNIEANRLSSSVRAEALPWGLLNAIDYADEADLVLGSDLTYNSGSWPVLAETMATIVRPGGHVLYLSCGHEGFNVNAEVAGFVEVAKQAGLVAVPDLYGQRPSDLLPALLSPAEATQLAATGGARVLVLQRKPVVKKT